MDVFGHALWATAGGIAARRQRPRFDWAFGIYHFTHSGVVWAFCFGAVWLVARRPVVAQAFPPDAT